MHRSPEERCRPGRGLFRRCGVDAGLAAAALLSGLLVAAVGVASAAGSSKPLGYASNPDVIKVGFLHPEAAAFESEWREYWGFGRRLRADNIVSTLVDERGLLSTDDSRAGVSRYPVTEDELVASFKRFNVIVLTHLGGDPGVVGQSYFDEKVRRNLPKARRALVRYVREGGGLFLVPHASRYPGTQHEEIASELLQDFGLEILREANLDHEQGFRHPGNAAWRAEPFFYTDAIAKHRVSEGVRRLYLLAGHGSDGVMQPGSVAVKYSEDWTIVARGGARARSHPTNETNTIQFDREGTYASAPPLAALRRFGKGRVFVLSSRDTHLFLNYGTKVWPSVSETVGEGKPGRRSDTLKLAVQALRWLGAPSLHTAGFGGYTPPPYAPVRFPKTSETDTWGFAKPQPGVRGIVGAHTSLSDGSGSVADYVRAAKQAGLGFIVFTDPLEKLSAEELESLKREAARASDASFHACPGVEFTDSLGVRWVSFGKNVRYPPRTLDSIGKSYSYWDGRVMFPTGAYSFDNSFSPTGLLGTRALNTAGGHQANLWWYYRVFPLVYDGSRLVESDLAGWKFALRDLRKVAPASYTRIESPGEVRLAADTYATVLPDVKTAKAWCSSRASRVLKSYVTQGPRIDQWEVHSGAGRGYPMEETAGQQRTTARFVVRSDSGIDEVLVHHADFGPVRRFLGHGEEELTRQFEMVFDKQRQLFLEVRDRSGKIAISKPYFLYHYPGGVYRCDDNLNYLGSSTLLMHPDRHQRMALARGFEGGLDADYRIYGVDGAGPPPRSSLRGPLKILTTHGPEPDRYGRGELTGVIIDPVMLFYDISIFEMDASTIADAPGTGKRPEVNRGPILRHVKPRRYIEHRETSYLLRSRKNYNIAWGHRRPYESAENYRGGLMWHEGMLRVKQDVEVPAGVVSMPLVQLGSGPKGVGKHLFVDDHDKGPRDWLADGVSKPEAEGRIAAGGYAALMPSVLGYSAVLPGTVGEFRYQASKWRRSKGKSRVSIGFGKDRKGVYKAGTELQYRFLVATLPDTEESPDRMQDIAEAYNLDGSDDGYPYTIRVGHFEDAEFFFTAKAVKHELVASLGPREMISDLGFRVTGLEDNGCAATYVAGRNFFRFVPVHEGTAYFQEPIDTGLEIWVGNVFLADRPEIQLTLVRSGRAAGKPPFLEVHNPGDARVRVRIHSPPNTPIYGGRVWEAVAVPAGDSIRIELDR